MPMSISCFHLKGNSLDLALLIYPPLQPVYPKVTAWKIYSDKVLRGRCTERCKFRLL